MMAEQPLLLGLELARVLVLELGLLLPALHHFISDPRPFRNPVKISSFAQKIVSSYSQLVTKINSIIDHMDVKRKY